MSYTRRLFALVLVLFLVAVACNRGAGTTTTVASTAPPAPSETTVPSTVAPTTSTIAATTTTLPPSLIVLDYAVRFKGTTDGKNTVILEIETGVATDLALEALAQRALEEFSPIETLFVVDIEEAVELVRLDPDGLTDEEASVLAQHYLLRIDGNTVTYQGPFADLGEFILGS